MMQNSIQNLVLLILAVTSICVNATTTPGTATDASPTTNDTTTMSIDSTTTEANTSAVSSDSETIETTETTGTTTQSIQTTDPRCPGGVGQLGTEYTIVGDRSNYRGVVWVRPTDGRYVVTCNPSCSPVAGYSATINATHSTLTINSVGMADAGTWGILDATVVGAIPVDVCPLTAASVPGCRISSDDDTDSLEPGSQLTLTVDITGYYCSLEAGFDLTTGDVTEELTTKHNVSAEADSTLNTTFNVDITRLGDVTMDFLCDRRWPLRCSGVQRLLKSPPQCNISSDTDTNALKPGSNLTLTVDIKNYYCSQQAGFTLTTGGITKALSNNQIMDEISDSTLMSSFIVTADYLGEVSVNFMCDNNTGELTCRGIDKLSEAVPSTTTVGSTSTAALSRSTASLTSAEIPNSSLGNTALITSPATPEPTTEGSVATGPSDNTTGLAIGLSVLGVIIIIVIVLVRYRRRVGGYFLSRRQRMHEVELENGSENTERHTPTN